MKMSLLSFFSVTLLMSMGVTASTLLSRPEDGRAYLGMSFSLSLRCKIDDEEKGVDDIEWRQVDEEGLQLPVPRSDVTSNSDWSVLEVSESGSYVCVVKSSDKTKELSKTFVVEPLFRLKKMEKSYTVTHGEDLKLFCTLDEDVYIGDSDPIFKWYSKPDLEGQSGLFQTEVASSEESESATTISWNDRNDTNVNNENRNMDDDEGDLRGWKLMETSERLRPDELEPHFRIINPEAGNQSVLKIEDALYEDRAYYLCQVTNARGQRSRTSTLVRIKSNYALFYPVVVLIVEVVLLCSIIFICERKKGGDTVDDDDDDEEEEHNGRVPSHDQGLRQRRR